MKTVLTCNGSYSVTPLGVLEVDSDCSRFFEKIVDIKTDYLTIKVSDVFFKYKKEQ